MRGAGLSPPPPLCRPARLIAALDVPIGAALILGGLLTGVVLFTVFGAVFLLLGLFRLYRAHQISRGLRTTIARHRSS